MKKITIEVCCGSVDDCIIAQDCGADRIELNHALELGGMTPSIATVKKVKEMVTIPICAMVRPRGFGFCYSNMYYEVMKMEAKDLIDAGVDGIVFGFLHEDGTIDVERTKEMVQIIHPKTAVFHKAFDSTPDLEIAIQQLIDCGIDRILTSGGAIYPDIEEGCKILANLQEKYGDKIEILPGGGVREHNVESILAITKASQIHMTAKHTVLDTSTMHHGTSDNSKENHSYIATQKEQLSAIISKIKNIH